MYFLLIQKCCYATYLYYFERNNESSGANTLFKYLRSKHFKKKCDFINLRVSQLI